MFLVLVFGESGPANKPDFLARFWVGLQEFQFPVVSLACDHIIADFRAHRRRVPSALSPARAACDHIVAEFRAHCRRPAQPATVSSQTSDCIVASLRPYRRRLPTASSPISDPVVEDFGSPRRQSGPHCHLTWFVYYFRTMDPLGRPELGSIDVHFWELRPWTSPDDWS